MSKTITKAGRVLVAFVDNGQGRRVLLAQDNGRPGLQLAQDTITAATHKGELRALVKALRELVDEMPDDPAAPSTAPPRVIPL